MERKQAIAEAQAHLIRVLAESKMADVNIGAENNDLYDLLSELISTRDELNQRIRDAVSDLEKAVPYINGGEGRFNSLGLLQGEGPRIDALTMKFDTLSRLAKGALVSYYVAK